MSQAFGAPKSEKGYIAFGFTLILVGSLFLILMIWIWTIKPQIDILTSSIILIIFASFFILIGIILIVKRHTLLEKRLARGDSIF
jgi:hypothetical protein